MQILRNRDQQAGQEGFGGRADADPCMVTPRLNPLGRPRCHREKRFRLTSSLTGCYIDYTVRGLDATRVPLIKVCRPHDLQEETGMITTVTRLGYRVIAVSFLCAAYGASALQAQQTVPLTERVQILNVDSLYAGMWVYYSRGYKDRAEAIGRQITASNQFYEESLGIDVDIRVALWIPWTTKGRASACPTACRSSARALRSCQRILRQVPSSRCTHHSRARRQQRSWLIFERPGFPTLRRIGGWSILSDFTRLDTPR